MVAKLQKRKKKALPRRAKTGLGGVPSDKGFAHVMNYFHFEVANKDLSESIKGYVRKTFSKKDSQSILANPEFKFYAFTHHCATAWWMMMEMTMCEKSEYYANALNNYLQGLIESGRIIQAEKKAQAKDDDKVVSLSPMQRLQNKIGRTIMQDLLDLEDSWIEGEKTTIDIYSLFKKHGLPSSATAAVREVVEGWLLDYEDAYHKRCPDAVEGYSHLKRPELNRRIKSCQEMLSDIDRIKSAGKATRATRVKGPKAADKQVTRVNYKKEDTEFKLVSIPPIQIIGKRRLYIFNTKYKSITEFISNSVNGFQISGSTLKDFDPVNSRSVKLRKPNEFLPIALGKTPNQIDKEWQKLTTKTTVPNGRINKETILLRVMDQ